MNKYLHVLMSKLTFEFQRYQFSMHKNQMMHLDKSCNVSFRIKKGPNIVLFEMWQRSHCDNFLKTYVRFVDFYLSIGLCS